MVKRKLKEIESGSESDSGSESESKDNIFTYPQMPGQKGPNNPDHPDPEILKAVARSMINSMFPGTTDLMKKKFENIIENFDQDATGEDLMEEAIDILDVLGDYVDEILPNMMNISIKQKYKWLKTLEKDRPDLLKIYHRSMIKLRKIHKLFDKDITKSENFLLKEKSRRRKKRKIDSDEEI
jgi:hypothetical protein